MLEQFSSYIFEQYSPSQRINSRKNSRTSITSGGDIQIHPSEVSNTNTILQEIVQKAMSQDQHFQDLKLIKVIRKLWKEEVEPLIAKKLKQHLASNDPNLLGLYVSTGESPALKEEKIKQAFDSIIHSVTNSQEYKKFSSKVDAVLVEGKEDFIENQEEQKQSPAKESPYKILRTSTSSVSNLNESPAVIRLPSLGDSPYQPKMKTGTGHFPGLEKSFSQCTDSTQFEKFMGSLEQSNPQNFRDFLKLKQLASANSKEAAQTLIFLPVVDIASSDFWPKISTCLKNHLPQTPIKLSPAVMRFLFKLSKQTSQVFPSRFFQTFTIALSYFETKFTEFTVVQRIKMAHYFEGSASAFSIHSLRAHQEMVSGLLNRLFQFLAKGQQTNSVLLFLILQDPDCEWFRTFLNRRIFRNICFDLPHEHIKQFFKKCISCFTTSAQRLTTTKVKTYDINIPGRKLPMSQEEIDLLSLNWCCLLFGSLILKRQYQSFFHTLFTQNSFNLQDNCVSIFSKLLSLPERQTPQVCNLTSSIRNFFVDSVIFLGTLDKTITHSLFSILVSSIQKFCRNQAVNSQIFLYLYDIVATILRKDKSQYNFESLVELQIKILKKLPQIQEQQKQKLLIKELVVLKALVQRNNKLSQYCIDPLCLLTQKLQSPNQFKMLLSTLLSLAQFSITAGKKLLTLNEFRHYIEEKILPKIKARKRFQKTEQKALLLFFKGQFSLKLKIRKTLVHNFLKDICELDLQFNKIQVLKSSITGQNLKTLIVSSRSIAQELIKEIIQQLGPSEKLSDIEIFKLLSLILFILKKYPEMANIEGFSERIQETEQSLPSHGSELREIVNEILGL